MHTQPTRRSVWTSAVAILTGLIVATAALSAAPASSAAPKGSKGRLVIVMKAPKGVPAQALVARTGGTTLVKAAGSSRQTVTLRVRSGNYKVKPMTTTVGGQTWQARPATSSVRVEKGATTRLVLKWRKVVSPVKVQVMATTASSVALEWTSRKARAYVVRRNAGETAPRSRKDGSKVAISKKARSVDDSGLAADTTYTYAVFARTKRGWTTGSVVTTATTPAPGVEPSAASYALLPHATVVEPGDADVVTVVAGQVWVRTAVSRPAPTLGAGMALPISATLPGGYLGTIAEIASDGRTVRLVQAALPEVFSLYDLSTSFDQTLDYAPITAQTAGVGGAARTVPKSSGGAPTGSSAAGGLLRTTARSGAETSCEYNAGQLKVSVDPSLKVSGRFGTQVHSTWGIPHAVTVDSDVTMTATAKMDLEVGQEVSCSLGMDDFVLTFTTTPIPMSLLWEAGATVSAAGALKVNGLGNTTTASFGATARVGTDASFTPRASVTGDMLNPTGEGSATAAVSIGGAVTVGPGAGTKDVGVIAGIGGTFDVFKASANGAFGADEGSSCLTVSAETAGSLRFYAKAWAGPLTASAEFPLWEGSQKWGSRTWPVGCDQVDPSLGAGDVQATLTWSNSDDMDLHILDPAGIEIWYDNPTSLTGGELDQDQIPDCDPDLTGLPNAENIFWPTGASPAGTYQVWVEEYNDCSSTDATWTLTVRVDGVVVLRRTGSGTSPVYGFTNG